jgi:transketolase
LDHFGASAPWQVLFEEYGITPARVVEETKKLMGR